jgi:hypothetical protein
MENGKKETGKTDNVSFGVTINGELKTGTALVSALDQGEKTMLTIAGSFTTAGMASMLMTILENCNKVHPVATAIAVSAFLSSRGQDKGIDKAVEIGTVYGIMFPRSGA